MKCTAVVGIDRTDYTDHTDQIIQIRNLSICPAWQILDDALGIGVLSDLCKKTIFFKGFLSEPAPEFSLGVRTWIFFFLSCSSSVLLLSLGALIWLCLLFCFMLMLFVNVVLFIALTRRRTSIRCRNKKGCERC